MATLRPNHAYRTLPTPLQPSEDEIQREVENLRDIRRRSTAQGGPGPVIDPDLPSASAQQAAANYRHPDDSSSDSHSNEDLQEPQTPGDDPFHLFWVPAGMHPEIDPAQFRQFLKEHARGPADGTATALTRAGSVGSTGLGRKRSMLSRQYHPPSDDSSDDGSEEKVVPLRRNRTSYYNAEGPQLTIKDLEKLDELAEEASQSSDPSRLRSVLRRSLSMNVSPSAIDKMDNVPDMGDEADAPIIVPRPGQILRRAARTKIRKPGQTGEGAHRFNATRRGSAGARAAAAALALAEAQSQSQSRTSSEQSSVSDDHSHSHDLEHEHEHGHGHEHEPRLRPRARADSLEMQPTERPESYSAETFIYDAYANDDDDERGAIVVSPILEPLEDTEPRRDAELTPIPLAPMALPTFEPLPAPQQVQQPSVPPQVLQPVQPPLPAQQPLDIIQPVPQRAPAVGAIIEPYRGASPDSLASVSTTTSNTLVHDYPSTAASSTVGHGSQESAFTPRKEKDKERDKDKDKDKKGGGLFKWGSDRKGKKEKEKEKEKEKNEGFFGSLFGGSRKKADDAPPGLGHGAGREAAAALLGASKARSAGPSPSPQPLVNNYARYPIHVERAIYRLSHIKLANPRRPLYEQVLISNLMFWYLGVINKAQTQAQQQQQQQQAQQQQAQEQQAQPQQAQQQSQQPQSPPPSQQQPQQPAPTSNGVPQLPPSFAEREREDELAEQQRRRGGLSKPSGRRAEMPVRGPQYDMQHRAMEQEHFGRVQGAGTGAGYAGAGLGAGYAGTGPYAAPQTQGAYASSVGQAAGPPPGAHHTLGGPAAHHAYDGVNGRPPLTRESTVQPQVQQQQQQQSWQAQQRAAAPSSPAPRRGASPAPSPQRTPSPPPRSQHAHAHAHQQSPPRRSRSPPPHNRYVAPEKAVVTSSARAPTRSVSANANGSAKNANLGRKTVSAHAQPAARRPPSEDEDVPLAMWQQAVARRR
ncbi:hypothetical protein K488DRAFT_78544 [Vararia minispora EC-137]|uniref:Uncharacterized protein n=1 Tax=Vararia minispora EC-137 TaxID=1314806 RepID=A0ACB8QKD6_9AGAM|nr:hypothetical protein K488DRAFT_78544 [Vararia minispora EC-137]